MEHFLTIPEEILLLTIDAESGESLIDSSKTLDIVLASSILMDLAIRNKLDTDTERLFLVNKDETGDTVLDEALKEIVAGSEEKDSAYWVGQVGMRSEEFKETIIAGLVSKGVLKVEKTKVLWMFNKRTYPVQEDKEIKEVKSRIRELVAGDDIPDLRDIVIISLCNYGSMLHTIFAEKEVETYKNRIKQIARMDLIGQSISKALYEFASSRSASKGKSSGKTPENKLEQMVNEVKTKYRIKKDEDLPKWLRKGTPQYQETLAFIRQKNTTDFYYHTRKKEYVMKKYTYRGTALGDSGFVSY